MIWPPNSAKIASTIATHQNPNPTFRWRIAWCFRLRPVCNPDLEMHTLFGIKTQSVLPTRTRPVTVDACFLEAVLAIHRTDMRQRFRLEAPQRHRHAFIEGSPLVFRWIFHVRCQQVIIQLWISTHFGMISERLPTGPTISAATPFSRASAPAATPMDVILRIRNNLRPPFPVGKPNRISAFPISAFNF